MDGDETTELTVPARGRAEHAVAVAAGERVAWQLSVSSDVSLAVRFVADSGAAETQLVAAARTSSSMRSFCPAHAGTLTIAFDNSHSVFASSKVARISIARGDDSSAVLAGDPTLANSKIVEGMTLFFTNHFDAAEVFFARHKDSVPIFALCWASVSFFRSVMTWEPDVIAEAQARVRAAQGLCEQWLPRDGGVLASLKGLLLASGASAAAVAGAAAGGQPATAAAAAAAVGGASGSSSGGLTECQLEATLVYSEVTMLSALLALQEESLLALLKTGLAIRSGWRHYQAGDRALGGCASALLDAPQLQVLTSDARRAVALLPRAAGVAAVDCLLPAPPDGDAAAAAPSPRRPAAPTHGHVLGGFLFGLGAFNSLASILPPIVMRVIAVLGFPSDRRAGLAQLRASSLQGGATAPLALLFLLSMRVLLPSFHSGDVTEHVAEGEAALALALTRYPDSALFLWLGGRLSRMQGDVARAHALLSRAHHIPASWPQLRHLCEYELGWNDAFRLRWHAVGGRFALLAAENAWSKLFYTFMVGVSALQRGELRVGRAALVRVVRLWLRDASRRLGNRVISADQYALRRAVEFVAATTVELPPPPPVAPAGCSSDDGDECGDDVDAAIAASGGYAGPRLLLPHTVARGSAAHAACLAAPLPLPGLEVIYLFNGAPQMDAPALHAALRQVDGVLAAVAAGRVFDAQLPLWSAGGAGGGSEVGRGSRQDDSAGDCWDDGDPEEEEAAAGLGAAVGGDAAPASQPEHAPMEPAAVTALLCAAGSVATRAWHAGGGHGGRAGGAAAGASSSGGGSSSSDATPAGATASSGGSSGGFLSGLRASLGSTAAAVSSAAAAITDGALSAVGLGGGGGSGSGGAASVAALPAFARPLPLAPVHVTAVAALVRGTLCAALGRVDEAAACFQWVVQQQPQQPAGGGSKRELHAFAYAHYELAVLHIDGLKTKAGGAGAGLHGEPPAGRHSRKLAGLARSALLAPLSAPQCVAAARTHLKAARGVRDDFNWRVRLHMRCHLSGEDLRTPTSGGGGGSAWGATSWAQHDALSGAAAAGEGDEAEGGPEEEEEGEEEGGAADPSGERELAEGLAAAVAAAEAAAAGGGTAVR